MITTLREYYNLLYLIQNENPPKIAILAPGSEPVLTIDLNTRLIDAPKTLSVESDHHAETVYFKVARFFDNVDLASMGCVVQYINANGDSGLYVVPFLDTTSEEGYLIFPWVIDGLVTAKAGKVTFAVQFFSVSGESTKYSYNLNTRPAQSEVLVGNTSFNMKQAVERIETDLNVTLQQLVATSEIDVIDFTNINSNLSAAYAQLVIKMNEIKESGAMNLYWVSADELV